KVFHAKPQDGDDISAPPKGLQKTYQNLWHQFSLRDIRQKGLTVMEALAGTTVLIKAEGADGLRVGTPLYKVRSSRLRQKVAQLTKATTVKTGCWRQVSLHCDLKPDHNSLLLTISAHRDKEILATQILSV